MAIASSDSTPPDLTPRSALRQALTPRALITGLTAVTALNLMAPYSEWVVRSTHMSTNYFPLGLAFVFILLVSFLNPLLKLLGISGYSPNEFGFIYMMLLAAVSVPTYGMTGYVISISASPFYFATPENGWADYLHPHLPMWALPGGGPEVKWFFEGLPAGASIPWSIWIVPLFWWATMMAATLCLCISLIAVFQKQWVDKERLNLPLVDVPLLMMESSDDVRALPQFMRSRLFWAGFFLAAGKIAWDVPGYFSSQWPMISRIELMIAGGKILPGIRTFLSLPLVGITYFVNADVIFSVWVFNLLNLAEIALFNRTGLTTGSSEIYSVSPAALAWQGFGAFSAIVIGGIWVAREHLAQVFRKAVYDDPEVDDSGEILSYRAAVITGFLSGLYILLFLNAMGIALVVAVLLLFAVIVVYLGLTRVVIEGGLVFVRSPLLPQGFAMHVIGPAVLQGPTMAGLGLSYAWACDPIATFMPFGANAAKVNSTRQFPRGVYLTAVSLALGFSLVLSFWYSLKLAYTSGGFNFGEWVFRGGAQAPYDTMVSKIQEGSTISPGRFIFLGLGVAATVGMTFLRHRFSWWRLHPIGFSVASVLQVQWSLLSLFVAWLSKTVLIRYGGLILFDRAKPLFIGLVVGHFTGAGFSFVIDAIWFTGQGHSLYW
jgi:hypothetical protein